MQMTQDANHDLRREGMRNRQKWNEEEKQKRRDRETRKTGHDAPKLRSLQDTTEIEAYLINFKAHMTMFEIHPDYWVPNLMAMLDEKSLAYLTDLPTESKKDIDTLGHTLMEYHGISTSFYREEWRNFREKPGETGHEYVKWIHSLITKWTRDCENREKLIDRILIEKACQSLSDTRTQVGWGSATPAAGKSWQHLSMSIDSAIPGQRSRRNSGQGHSLTDNGETNTSRECQWSKIEGKPNQGRGSSSDCQPLMPLKGQGASGVMTMAILQRSSQRKYRVWYVTLILNIVLCLFSQG